MGGKLLQGAAGSGQCAQTSSSRCPETGLGSRQPSLTLPALRCAHSYAVWEEGDAHISGCKVITPKFEVVTRQVFGWQEALRSRQADGLEEYAMPFTW